MTRPRWLGRAAMNRHRHAIEQAPRRWRGGRRGDSGRTRRKFDFRTGGDCGGGRGMAAMMAVRLAVFLRATARRRAVLVLGPDLPPPELALWFGLGALPCRLGLPLTARLRRRRW